MSRLNDRERHILKLRFYQGRTQMEVAGEIGISQAQVSRLEKNALVHMRKNMGIGDLANKSQAVHSRTALPVYSPSLNTSA